MRSLHKRVDDLEQRLDPMVSKPWHQVIQSEGQTSDEAVAAYEAENGPVGDDNLLIRRIVAPGPRESKGTSR